MLDANLRDTENVPLHEGVETYFKRETLKVVTDRPLDMIGGLTK